MKPVFLVLSLIMMSGCAFNSAFFPADNRPDHKIDAFHRILKVKINHDISVDLFQIPPAGQPKANIIVFQGSGNKVRNYYKVVQPLHEAGYQLFMMEYPGFGDASGATTHDNVANAANHVVKYLHTEGLLSGLPLLALGHSYGGQLAIYTAAQDVFIDAVIVEGTFTSFSEEAAWSTPAFVRPLVRAIFSEPYRAEELIKKLDSPLLIIHSMEDKRVPFYMGETLYKSASSYKKEFWSITGKHLEGLEKHQEEYIEKIDSLFFSVWQPTVCQTPN